MNDVDRHYGRERLDEAILGALRAAGKDAERLTLDDLAPVDQFHVRGREATLELARLARIDALPQGSRVLDVGGGIGGAARTLAAEFGCHVTVLDLTDEYCRTGEALSARVGLAERVAFRRGDAQAMPFDDETFDVVWTQHSSMNVPDKRRLYAEIRRVLRPGGTLALHEIMGGAGGEVIFPVPWASSAAISFVEPTTTIRDVVVRAGFHEITWVSVSAVSLDWLRERLAATGPPPPVGIHLLLGEGARTLLGNLLRNLEEDRVRIVEAVFRRA